MPLNRAKGNMYTDISHTWNPLGGECPHKCSYCSTNKLSERYPVIKDKYSGEARLIEKELKTNLGEGNTIFVCAQHDLFADSISPDIVFKVLQHCRKYPKNKYLFQTKNPKDLIGWGSLVAAVEDFALCTTIETNRVYEEFMGETPFPLMRALHFKKIPYREKYVTIEPIMDFDLHEMVVMMLKIKPLQVNIGADSGGNNLPEPSKEKVLALISELSKFTKVKQKKNLDRLLK